MLRLFFAKLIGARLARRPRVNYLCGEQFAMYTSSEDHTIT